MSKDDEIQELREKLARTEGERDALKDVVRDKVSTAPLSLLNPKYCSACGSYCYGPYHVCSPYVTRPYVSPWNPPFYQTVTTSGTYPSDSKIVVNGYTPPGCEVHAYLDGKAIT
jgi:hypothetical protein